MRASNQNGSLSKPRWDGTRIIFEIEAAGEMVQCAISRSALQDLSGHRHFASADLLRCFADARSRIEKIAGSKLVSRPEGSSGIVSIWSEDVDDPPAAPAVARRLQLPSGRA